jgi:hypothetical protein
MWATVAACVVACTTVAGQEPPLTPSAVPRVEPGSVAASVDVVEPVSIPPRQVSAEKARQVANSWLFAMAMENANELANLSAAELFVTGVVVEGEESERARCGPETGALERGEAFLADRVVRSANGDDLPRVVSCLLSNPILLSALPRRNPVDSLLSDQRRIALVRPLNLDRLDARLHRYRSVLTELAESHFPVYFYATDGSGSTVHGAIIVDGTAKVSRVYLDHRFEE